MRETYVERDEPDPQDLHGWQSRLLRLEGERSDNLKNREQRVRAPGGLLPSLSADEQRLAWVEKEIIRASAAISRFPA